MKAELDALTQEIISAAIAVHCEIGPGGLESTYETCLSFELGDRHLRIERQKPVPIVYRGRRLDCGYRLDLLVEEKVIVEVKAVRRFESVHLAQLISYLIHSRLNVGLLLNFHVKWFVDGGIKRVARDFRE
jgi:GxxExxY protein